MSGVEGERFVYRTRLGRCSCRLRPVNKVTTPRSPGIPTQCLECGKELTVAEERALYWNVKQQGRMPPDVKAAWERMQRGEPTG